MDKRFLCCRQHYIVMLLFADDCICYREIKDKEDTVNSSKTLMVYEVGTGFQPVKNIMMQKRTRSKNIQESFTLDGTVL